MGAVALARCLLRSTRVGPIVLAISLLGCGEEVSRPPGTPPGQPPVPAAAPRSSRTYTLPAAWGGQAGEEGGGRLVAPKGALEGDLAVEVVEEAPAGFVDAAVRTLGSVWTFRVGGADHHRFREPVWIQVPFDAARMLPGSYPISVRLAVWEGGTWKPVPGSYADEATGTVAAQVDHLSSYAPVQPADADRPSVVARWHVQGLNVAETGATIEGGAFGSSFWGPHARTEVGASLSFREELDPRTHAPLAIVEQCRWEASTSDLYFEDATGARLPAGSGGAGSGTVTDEEALQQPVYSLQQEDGKAKVAIYWPFERGEGATYEVETRPSELEGGDIRRNRVVAGAPTRRPRQVRFGATDLEGRIDEDGNGWFSMTDEGFRGRVGDVLGGWASWSRTASAVRIATPRHLVVRGRVWHRLRVPRDSGDENWVHPGETTAWGAIADRMIAPAGRVRLEVVLLDAATREPVTPSLPLAADAEGAFEVRLPLRAGRIVRLTSTFRSRAARLREESTHEIALDEVTGPHAPAADGTWDVSVGCVTRAFLREGGADHEFSLGADTRRAKARPIEGGVQLDLEQHASVFVNTFCYRATHVNQNLTRVRPGDAESGFSVQVPFPREQLLDAVPWLAMDDEVVAVLQRRLQERLDAGGSVIEVPVRGWQICFPTSTLMALDALGLESAGEQGVGPLAQAVADEFPRPAVPGPQYAWEWPFPDPGAYYAALLRVDDLPPWEGAEALERAFAPYATNWPFVDAGAPEKQREWLITVRAGSSRYRPWQITDFVFPAVRRRHPGRLALNTVEGDLFAQAQHRRTVRELGLGAVGTASIDHLGRYRSGGTYQGTHVLTLLGVVLGTDGNVVRHLFHDPYGDLTKSPGTEGYYGVPRDVDDVGHEGAYVPYGSGPPVTRAFRGTIEGNYWNVYRPAVLPGPAALRVRLLPSE